MELTKHGHVCEKIFSHDFWVLEKLGCYKWSSVDTSHHFLEQLVAPSSS
jgi:hypothetical protein